MRPEDRQALIRQNFEAYRDFTWAQDLEPGYRELGVSEKVVQALREAWNEHAEKRDWPWWQETCATYSVEQLDDLRMDLVELGDALGASKWQREQRPLDPGDGRDYQKTLADAARRPAANDNKKGIDR